MYVDESSPPPGSPEVEPRVDAPIAEEPTDGDAPVEEARQHPALSHRAHLSGGHNDISGMCFRGSSSSNVPFYPPPFCFSLSAARRVKVVCIAAGHRTQPNSPTSARVG